ncbi:MAG TPA: hypothetical protein VIT38_11420 [Allosphingosinicella sp.]
MKKFVLTAVAAGSAFIATSAPAQTVSGDVTITGSVAPKCLVVTGGTPNGTNFAGTIPLGELAQASGILRTGLTADFNTGGGLLNFQVVCTSARPTVTVDANPIVAATAAASAGYANTIHYNAAVTFDESPGPAETVQNDSLINAAATSLQLANRLATGATNIHIAGSNFRTPNATDVLVADPVYTGHLLITIAPTS